LCPAKKDKGNILNDIANGIHDALVWVDDRREALAFIGSGVLQIVGGAMLDAGGTAGGAALSLATFGAGTPGGVVIAGVSITAGTALIGTGTVTAAVGLAMLANNSTGRPKDNENTKKTIDEGKGNQTRLSEDLIKRRTGTDVHDVKNVIQKQYRKEIKDAGVSNNFDLYESNGKVVIKGNKGGKELNLNISLESLGIK
jgi:hypothetical protein